MPPRRLHSISVLTPKGTPSKPSESNTVHSFHGTVHSITPNYERDTHVHVELLHGHRSPKKKASKKGEPHLMSLGSSGGRLRSTFSLPKAMVKGIGHGHRLTVRIEHAPPASAPGNAGVDDGASDGSDLDLE